MGDDILVWVLASLASPAVRDGGSKDVEDVSPSSDSVTQPEVVASTTAPADNDRNDNTDPSVDSDFPMIDDAFHVVEMGGQSYLLMFEKLLSVFYVFARRALCPTKQSQG